MTRATASAVALRPYLTVLAIALVSGYAFSLAGIPIPWLLGPMIGVCAAARTFRALPLAWPGWVRNVGLIAVGYAIGLTFGAGTLRTIAHQLPAMGLMTLLLLLLCAAIAWVLSRVGGVPFPTALTGSVPGGLTQMITLAEETKGIDMTVVAFLQVSRLMMIVVSVPLLIFSPLFAADRHPTAAVAETLPGVDWGAVLPQLLPYAVVCTGCALLGKKLRLPTTFLLGPMLSAAALHLSGLPGPALPSPLLAAAQLVIGCYVGLLLQPDNLPNKKKLITLAVLAGCALIVGACGLSRLLSGMHAVSGATALLSLSPGGMDQMGIIAHEIGADVSIVTCYQLFRTFFIFFAIPPLLGLVFRALERRRSATKAS